MTSEYIRLEVVFGRTCPLCSTRNIVDPPAGAKTEAESQEIEQDLLDEGIDPTCIQDDWGLCPETVLCGGCLHLFNTQFGEGGADNDW